MLVRERSPETVVPPAFLIHFQDLPDPRVARSRVHLFHEVLLLALLAVLCGAEGWEDMHRFGQVKEPWLRERLGLELPAGIPCEDTFRRLFARIEPGALSACLQSWTEALRERAKGAKGEIISLDGKALRGSLDASLGLPALSVVRAWAGESRLILGAEPIDTAHGDCEMGALRRLLKLLDVQGAIVTADALHAQKETAAQVVSQGADYVLALKENQSGLRDDVVSLFEYLLAKPARDREWAQAETGRALSRHTETDKGHGRIELRSACVLTLAPNDPDWQDRTSEWPNLRSFVRIERVRRSLRDGKVHKETQETAFYFSSLAADASTLAAAVRRHWEAENCMHYVLDVSFGEDKSRVRRDHAPKNLAALRNIAANLHRRPKNAWGGIKARMKQAGWDNDYLLELLA
jgi:predicted transposase YbfD/YdcC